MTRARWEKLNIFCVFFFGFSLLVYLGLNAGAYLTVARYYLLVDSPFNPENLSSGIVDLPAALVSHPALPDAYRLVIPKMSVNVPIAFPENHSMPAILASLEDGVGLYPGSVLPGKNGRAILLGHSSKATWYHGDYAYVFSLLSKLKADDEFYISTNKKYLAYRVVSTATLEPQYANLLLELPPFGSEVDLLTCYPVGSASQRTIVRAQLVKTSLLAETN